MPLGAKDLMKSSKARWLFILVGVLLATAAMTVPLQSLAQGLTSVDSVLGATEGNDASMRVFGHLIGDNLKNPFTTLGAPQTLFGKLFLTLNTFTFLVGVLFASYGIGAGIVQTAHEGQVLGRRMSAIWMPIRMVTGVAGMIPFFGGFSLAQAVMMLASLLGIGLANYGWKQVISEFDQFSGMVRPAVGEKIAANSPLGLAYGIFSSEICAAARQEYLNGLAAPGASDSDKLRRHTTSMGVVKATAVVGYGLPRGGQTDSHCGRMEVKSLKGEATGSYTTSVSFGFTVGSVNYNAISNAMRNGIPGATEALWANVAPKAREWHRNWLLARDSGQPPPVPFTAIEEAAATFASTLGSAGKGAAPDAGAITNDAKEAMTRYGWFGAGAWYATLAQGQTAMMDAFKSVEITVVDPTELMMNESSAQKYSDAEKDAMSAYLKLVGERQKGGTSPSDSFSLAMGKLGDISTDTGNYSLGQSMVSMLLKSVGSGTGGGDYVNPIIMLKNVGDYLMTGVQTAYFGMGVLEAVPAFKSAKLIGAVTDGLTAAAGKSGAAGGVADKVGSIIELLMGAIFAAGALMSLYIPFIPFIAWMGALIQYVTIFFEGLVAAPIWAFAHLDADGEGMGQRAERGYIFILNMLFRPFLMVLGFVLAAGLLVVLGTFQMVMFMPAMANVQGNSITGVASILLLLGIFCMLNITMIHGLFNLITLIPDQVLGWVGNMGNTQLGKEVEEKAHQLFVGMGRGMAGGMSAGKMRPSVGAKPKGGDAAQGANSGPASGGRSGH